MQQSPRIDDPTSGPCFNIQLYHGGKFGIESKKTERCPDGVEYVGGEVRFIRGVKMKDLTYWFIYRILRELTDNGMIAFLWYIKMGQPMGIGRTLVCGDSDMEKVLKTADQHNNINLYVTKSPKSYPPTLSPDHKKSKIRSGPSKLPHSFKEPNPIKKSIPTTPTTPTLFTDSFKNLNLINTSSNTWPSVDVSAVKDISFGTFYSEPQTKEKLPFRKSGIVIRDLDTDVNVNVVDFVNEQGKGKEKLKEFVVPEINVVPLNTSSVAVVSEKERVVKSKKSCTKSVREHEGTVKEGGCTKSAKKSKGKGTVATLTTKIDGVSKIVKKKKHMGMKTVASRKGKGKKRKKGLIFDDEDDCNISEDSEYSDLDVDFEIGEDDLKEDDLFKDDDDTAILRGVESMLRQRRMRALKGSDEVDQVFSDCDEDSDDLKSLDGSDEELSKYENYPFFKQDLTKNVTLSIGLKFEDRLVLRKALVRHAIEQRYDFYYLHSGRKRVTTYCRDRCECPWDDKRLKIKCKCKNWTCFFKIHAKKWNDDSTFQIKSLNLKHTCVRNFVTTKVSSEYLADRYIEDWRDNPTWPLKAFEKRILRDLGFSVTYNIAYLARSRIKLMINGDSSDQYGRVWDYVNVVRKYNPGSSAIVVVDNIERPPPLFRSMYICLKACKQGWLGGCRPIIGVDGCHLRGQFPGMCLVAVGMDGNNNIYPIAWGVVDVENASSWTWFLTLLIEDLDKEEGVGLTFMSDRQKGLLDAFSIVAPRADIRYCARHIWANFKLRFSGQAYKNGFWKAARCTTKVEFDYEMNEIKCLDPKAYLYLAAIAPKHWSRHAFSTSSKSNMLLNNMCESFNNVIKEAREKPILTHMEWMRRYVMKRLCEKREGVKGVMGNLMPYVAKYLKWASDQGRFCTITQSSIHIFEVDWRGESLVVDLNRRECSCFHWQLTGLPCPHAVACITEKRGNIVDYIDVAYTKNTYVLSYTPSVSPMPGVKYWDKVDQLVDPLPPVFKKLPGRPNLKKRRKEAGEGTNRQANTVRMQRNCGNCGKLGHNMKTCQNGKVTATKNPSTKPLNTSAWSTKRREAAARTKATRARIQRNPDLSSIPATTHGPSSSQPAHRVTRSEPQTVQGSQTSVTQGVRQV